MIGAVACLYTRRELATLAAACGSLLACASAPLRSDPHLLLNTKPELLERVSMEGRFLAIPARGKVTVVDFWSTACAPCLALMPELESLWREHQNDDVAVIGIAIDDNPGLVSRAMKVRGISYPNVIDDDSASLQGAYRVDKLPRTLVFDRGGALRFTLVGEHASDFGAVRTTVKDLLAK